MLIFVNWVTGAGTSCQSRTDSCKVKTVQETLAQVVDMGVIVDVAGLQHPLCPMRGQGRGDFSEAGELSVP